MRFLICLLAVAMLIPVAVAADTPSADPRKPGAKR